MDLGPFTGNFQSFSCSTLESIWAVINALLSPILTVKYHIKNRSPSKLQYGCLEQYQIFSLKGVKYTMDLNI